MITIQTFDAVDHFKFLLIQTTLAMTSFKPAKDGVAKNLLSYILFSCWICCGRLVHGKIKK